MADALTFPVLFLLVSQFPFRCTLVHVQCVCRPEILLNLCVCGPDTLLNLGDIIHAAIRITFVVRRYRRIDGVQQIAKILVRFHLGSNRPL